MWNHIDVGTTYHIQFVPDQHKLGLLLLFISSLARGRQLTIDLFASTVHPITTLLNPSIQPLSSALFASPHLLPSSICPLPPLDDDDQLILLMLCMGMGIGIMSRFVSKPSQPRKKKKKKKK